jgi:hypothetical protein
MNLKKNLFIVLTEYQFLQAINIATSIYNSSEYFNSIYLVRNGNRLQGIDVNIFPNRSNIKIHVFDYEDSRKIADTILNEKPSHFFFFQAISGLNVYLAHTFSKRSVEISLGPDGNQMYVDFNKKHHFLSVIKDSFKENLKMIKSEIFSGKVHKFDYYKYGNNNFIDNIWITHPSEYIHRSRNKVNILKIPDFNPLCIDFVRNCFNFNIDLPSQGVIYFFNQPLWGNLLEQELEFLKKVINTFPNNKILLKLHPLTDKESLKVFQDLAGVEILNSSVPAEVILLTLKNCIVYSGWSSVLTTDNKRCNYYYNYPIFRKINDPILNQINVVPLSHIRMIESPKEMKFPNA